MGEVATGLMRATSSGVPGAAGRRRVVRRLAVRVRRTTLGGYGRDGGHLRDASPEIRFPLILPPWRFRGCPVRGRGMCSGPSWSAASPFVAGAKLLPGGARSAQSVCSGDGKCGRTTLSGWDGQPCWRQQRSYTLRHNRGGWLYLPPARPPRMLPLAQTPFSFSTSGSSP